MQQLKLDLSIPHQLLHRGWCAIFSLNNGEWIYGLHNAERKYYADCHTGTDCLKLACKYAKENIETMLLAPPFVMSPTSSKSRGNWEHSSADIQMSRQNDCTADTDTTKPFLKWLGSKRWAVEQIRTLYDRQRRFVDLTLGSGALPLAIKPERVLACDINPQLIKLWQWVQRDGRFTIDLRSEESYFYECRELYNYLVANEPNHPKIPQLLYLLCRTSFNGLHRSSFKKAFNAPWGKYSKFSGATDLSPFIRGIGDWEFFCGDFRRSIEMIQSDDFVLFDPPYDSLDNKAFVGYAKSFTRNDQIAAARLLSELEAPVVSFNADTPFIRELYGSFGWDIKEVEVSRSVSCKGDRSKAKELIMTRNLSRN